MGALNTPASPYVLSSVERELVVSAQAGDARAFGELVRIYQRRAYAVARAIVFVHEDAEDAVQEGFLRAFRAIGRFRADEPFGAWLYRIVANAAVDARRRRRVRAAEPLSPEAAAPGRESDPAESAELRTRLSEALAQLPERARSVVVLHDVEGFTHAEIGAMLGIPEGTARSDLFHARKKLRGTLQDLMD